MDEVNRKQIIKRTEQEKLDLIDQWEKSGQPIKTFCEQNGFSDSLFHTWLYCTRCKKCWFIYSVRCHLSNLSPSSSLLERRRCCISLINICYSTSRSLTSKTLRNHSLYSILNHRPISLKLALCYVIGFNIFFAIK